MSHIEQVNAKLWSAHASFVLEPFAYISEMGDTFQVDDVEEGSLGSRRTFDEAVALVDRHAVAVEAEQIAHNGRVLAAIADLDAAA